MITLRDYQDQGVNEIRAAFADGKQSVLYVAPTGSGKTVCFAYIAQRANALGTRTCICVHRRELLRQASRSLATLGVEHGVIAPGERTTDGTIQVASVQTLVRRDVQPFNLLVFDEGHHAVAGTWSRILDRHPGARVLGVTATPCRLSGRGLAHVYDTLIRGPQITDLIEQGYLVPAQVWAPSTVDLKGIRSRGGDFERDKLAELLDRSEITGSAVDHYVRLANGLPAVAFCVSVAHAEHVTEQFRARGFRAESVDGSLSQDIRDDRFAALAGGRLNVLTSCELLSEGVDIPLVMVAVLLRPTKSTGLFIQQVGRCLRPSPGKDRAIIIDHVGNCLRHGLPDQDRAWSLERGVNARDKEAEPRIRQCSACYLVHLWALSCPECGCVYPVEERRQDVREVEGELEPVTPEERELIMEAARQAGTLQAWHKAARRLGYKSGWAWIQMKRQRASGRLERAAVGAP